MRGVTDQPPSLDELDAPTLTELLRTGGDPSDPAPTVRQVRAHPLGATTGFLGELRRLELSYDESGPAGPPTLVAKAPTTDPDGRQVGLMLNVWAREHRFFAELAPSCATRVPRCYANLADERTGRWLLLLGDAGDTTAPSQAEGAGRTHAEAALAEIATLHRGFAGGRPAAWLPGFDRGPLDHLQMAVTEAVEPFIERFGASLPSGGAELLRRFAPRLSGWAERQAQGPLTVVHADHRLDNLVFDAEGRVTVLDWQTALMGNGTMDVASFLATSLTVEDRRAWEEDLFALYGEAVGRSTDEVRTGVRHHLLWWMALFANNLSRIHPTDPRGRTMFEHTVQRTFQAAADHDAAALLAESF